jgi:hypothetical protein
MRLETLTELPAFTVGRYGVAQHGWPQCSRCHERTPPERLPGAFSVQDQKPTGADRNRLLRHRTGRTGHLGRDGCEEIV